MIKTKNIRNLLITGLVLTLCVCTIFALAPKTIKNVNASNLNFEEQIETQYSLGDVFAPPSAKIVYGGQDYVANASSVTFPDGKSYKADNYVLSIPGEYFVNYTAKVGLNIVSSKFSFVVSANAYAVSSSNSSAYFGSINNTDANGVVLTNEQGENVTTSGIVVSLAAGDVFTYKKPINLSGKTKLDNILSLYSLPEILGKADARILKVRLTDAYDSENYIEVVTYGNYGDEDEIKGWALYSGARANGQPITGLHFYANSNERTFTYQGQLYTHNKNISYNSANGYPSYEYSLAAKKGYGTGVYSLSMNYEEKQLFGCKTIAPSSNGMIIDLDEPLFFDNLWDGFTTGEVYLSVSADNYVGSSFSFIITDILDENLAENTFLDKTAPKIDVDVPNSIPSAIVGNAYKVFDAKAVDDVDGKLDLNVMVYRNYYSSNPVAFNVINGAFIPNQEGVYTIIYKAIDSTGNVQTVKYDVLAKEQSQLSIDISATQTNVKAGEVIQIATPIVSGNDGEYSLTVSVVNGDKRTQVLPNENGEYYYLCLEVGDFRIEYECVDYNVKVSKSYGITVAVNQIPTFVSNVYLPPVFVNGVEYTLPNHKGYDFSSGTATEIGAKIYYSFDGGEYLLLDTNKLKITASETVKIKYSLGGSEPSSNQEYVVDVANVGISDNIYIRSNYFYGKDFNVQANDKFTSYTSVAKDAKLVFVNKVLVTDFSLKYQLKDSDCKKVVFTLSDYVDQSKVLTIALRVKDAESYYVSINNQPETIVSKSINESATLSYKDDDKILSIGGLSFKLNDFGGLDSKLAWLSVSFVENNYTQFNVTEINAQQITSAQTDNAAPVYSIKVNNDQKKIGEKLIVSRFIASDVLKFSAQCVLTVYAPDGKPCVSVDGVTMENVSDFTRVYEIQLNSLGKYRIVGSVTDGARRVPINREVVVKDDVAPVITLENVKTTAKKGNVKIANYSVQDNDDSVFVTVCVQRPDKTMISVTDNKFRATEKGTYTVMIFATDKTGNTGFASYEVVVR